MNPTKEQKDKLQQAAGTDQKVKKAVKEVAFHSTGNREFWKAHDCKTVPRTRTTFNYLTDEQWREHGPLLITARDRVRDEFKREAGEADAQQPLAHCEEQLARFKQTREYQDALAAKNGEASKQPANAEQAAGTDQKVKEVVKRVAFYSAGKLEFWQAHDCKSVPRREVEFN